jgi:putative Holliday junction resolvase
MALDLGEKRTGIAVSDPAGTVAQPLVVLPTQDLMNKAATFRRLLEDYEIELLVVGLPVSLDGSPQAQARRIQDQAARLETLYELPLEFIDERLSSKEAKGILRQLGYSEKEMRGNTDKIAASIMLQTWLDNRSYLKNLQN